MGLGAGAGFQARKKENTLADNPESVMPEIFCGPKFQEPRDPFGVYIVYSSVFEKMIICSLHKIKHK